MQINKVSNDVYEIENFLSQEEIFEVNKIISNTPEEDWFNDTDKNQDSTPGFWYGKNLRFKTKNIFDSINNNMKNLFESYSYYPGELFLQRYKKGDYIKQHRDQWLPDLDYYIGYGFCLYYNDDYAGGELSYPELNIVIKPKSNSLYIHAGHIMHGSLPVLDDKTRYFSTVFIRGTKESPTILKKELFL